MYKRKGRQDEPRLDERNFLEVSKTTERVNWIYIIIPSAP
jgi:hypothetical protein